MLRFNQDMRVLSQKKSPHKNSQLGRVLQVWNFAYRLDSQSFKLFYQCLSAKTKGPYQCLWHKISQGLLQGNYTAKVFMKLICHLRPLLFLYLVATSTFAGRADTTRIPTKLVGTVYFDESCIWHGVYGLKFILELFNSYKILQNLKLTTPHKKIVTFCT